MRNEFLSTTKSLPTLLILSFLGATLASGQKDPRTIPAPSRIAQTIDGGSLFTLHGHVRRDLTPDKDLGAVEDSMPIRLYLVLTRAAEQQADLDWFIARQQQPGSAEYHKWLTPKEYGARFGAAPADIAKINAWLESQGMQVRSVLNNASMIEFETTAGALRSTFHVQMHYWNIMGAKYAANANDPQIPAALSNIVGAIDGLVKIPPQSNHTAVHPVAYDAESHRWHNVQAVTKSTGQPEFTTGGGLYYDVTPGDFYTIYNASPIYKGGNLGAGATIGLPEASNMNFGTVASTTGQASGGDVNTFRSTFGVPGTLNMTVMHGAGTVTCGDPGEVPGFEGKANLDAEWANAVAPSAHLLFMSCDDSNSIGYGFTTALVALIDNNLSDVISDTFGTSELSLSSSDYTMDDQLAMQAATQGQTFIAAAGDGGSADADAGTKGTAESGLNVGQYAGVPLITAVGGTDFSDKYDADEGGLPQSTYWSSTNTKFYSDALGYIPETAWNGSCADSIIANDPIYGGGQPPLGDCDLPATEGEIFGTTIGGGGGFSMHYAQPSYQTGTPGLSSSTTNRAVPDIAFFAGAGFWFHDLIVCDSTTTPPMNCVTPSAFGAAGGTSFAASQFAGVAALLVTASGERQGTLNPAIYALAKAQFASAATKTACYANGQTNNIGVTAGLPASACIFHDATTGNNDEPCLAGGYPDPDCVPGDIYGSYGVLSATGSSSLTIAYPAGPGYDEATGLGSLNIANFINNFHQAFTSSTSLKANPTSITAAQSTTLTATITSAPPTGYTGTAPSLTGMVTFKSGTTTVGSCTISGGTCSATVAGSALTSGANSMTAVFSGSSTYPSSVSSVMTVTVTSTAPTNQTITFGPLPNKMYGAAAFTLTATASSGLPVTYTATGPATVSGSTMTITGAGTVDVTASQAGNSSYAPATPVSQSFSVAKASLTATATNLSRTAGTANPTLSYGLTGFVDGDTTAVVDGSATLITTAITASPPGSYPITFSTEALTATNYTFTYVAGTLTVTAAAGQCQVIDYGTGFSAAGLTLNEGATVTDNLLQLTDGKTNEARSAFFTTKVPISSFVTDFTFQLLNPNADGFAFVVQGNSPTQVGQLGLGLGYAGIKDSAAVKFDLYNNGGEGVDSTGIYYDGAEPTTPAINLAPSGIDLHNGHVFAVHLFYTGSIASLKITDTTTKATTTISGNVEMNLIGPNAYVGFTAGTGSKTATQDILSWTYSSGPSCPVN